MLLPSPLAGAVWRGGKKRFLRLWEEVGSRLRKPVNASQAGYLQPLSAPHGNRCCTGTS